MTPYIETAMTSGQQKRKEQVKHQVHKKAWNKNKMVYIISLLTKYLFFNMLDISLAS